MNLSSKIPDFNAPVVEHARKDFPLLDAEMTVGEALERIRREGVGERVIYFYAIDEEKRLVGVVPTRRLLTAPLETALREVMVRRVVAVPAKATVLDACEFFVLYKFLAFPVVDEQRRMVGVIDANLFAEEILEAGDTEDQSRSREAVPVGPEFFEALGFRLEQIRGASAWRAFRFRFPWLLVTVIGGTLSAILAGFFEATLAGSSNHSVFSDNGAGIKRKRQHAIDERDDSCVALSQRDPGLARRLRSVANWQRQCFSAFPAGSLSASSSGCGATICVPQLLSAEASRSRSSRHARLVWLCRRFCIGSSSTPKLPPALSRSCWPTS